MTPRGLFISGTGTSVGKTWIARGIARALARAGHRVAAFKPIETGCTPDALDALALSTAAGDSSLADDPAFYRARLPLAPYAVTLTDGSPPPDPFAVARAIQRRAARATITLIEGAGGLLVPVDATRTIADLARLLGLPLLLVAPDRLGVLSDALATVEAARSRALDPRALVLNAVAAHAGDPSPATNAAILRDRLQLPVLCFPACEDDDDALARAVEAAGLLSAAGFSS